MITSTAPTGPTLGSEDRRPPSTTHAREWDRTIPRSLVHKRAVSEVLLTSLRASLGRTSTVFAQWPPGNGFFRQNGGQHHGINVVLETVRQACVALTHTALGVSQSDQFVMLELAAEVEPDALRIGHSPRQIAIAAELATDVVVASGRRIRWRFVLRSDETVVGTGHGELIAMDPERYREMRRHQATTDDARPAAEGALPYDPIVRRVDDLTYELNVDPRNANFFDHPLDHVPGMLILEGPCEVARREHVTLTGRPALVVRAFARCRRFAELDEACLLNPTSQVESQSPLSSSHQIEVTQAGVVCATVDVGVASVSSCVSA